MEIRICAAAEVRKGCSMSKAPDLSAFPIPRKGGARPIDVDEVAVSAAPKTVEEAERAETADPPHLLTVVPARAPGPAASKNGCRKGARTCFLRSDGRHDSQAGREPLSPTCRGWQARTGPPQTKDYPRDGDRGAGRVVRAARLVARASGLIRNWPITT